MAVLVVVACLIESSRRLLEPLRLLYSAAAQCPIRRRSNLSRPTPNLMFHLRHRHRTKRNHCYLKMKSSRTMRTKRMKTRTMKSSMRTTTSRYLTSSCFQTAIFFRSRRPLLSLRSLPIRRPFPLFSLSLLQQTLLYPLLLP